MTAEEERLKNRFLDLAERAYRHGIPVFSPFLSEPENEAADIITAIISGSILRFFIALSLSVGVSCLV